MIVPMQFPLTKTRTKSKREKEVSSVRTADFFRQKKQKCQAHTIKNYVSRCIPILDDVWLSAVLRGVSLLLSVCLNNKRILL